MCAIGFSCAWSLSQRHGMLRPFVQQRLQLTGHLFPRATSPIVEHHRPPGRRVGVQRAARGEARPDRLDLRSSPPRFTACLAVMNAEPHGLEVRQRLQHRHHGFHHLSFSTFRRAAAAVMPRKHVPGQVQVAQLWPSGCQCGELASADVGPQHGVTVATRPRCFR